MFDLGAYVLIWGAVARITRLITTDRVPFAGIRAWTIRQPDRTTPPAADTGKRSPIRPIRRIRDHIDAVRGPNSLLYEGIRCAYCVSFWVALVTVAAITTTGIVDLPAWQAVAWVLSLSYLTGFIDRWS